MTKIILNEYHCIHGVTIYSICINSNGIVLFVYKIEKISMSLYTHRYFMNDTKKQITNMTSFESSTEYNYGQFVVLSENNEIVNYSKYGQAIYYAQDLPTTPMKTRVHNSKLRISENESIPKYPQYNDEHSKVKTHIITLLYGLLSVILFLVMFASFYILFFNKM